jgi:hypothetical protein
MVVQAGTLAVNEIHQDVPFTEDITAAVHDEIETSLPGSGSRWSAPSGPASSLR